MSSLSHAASRLVEIARKEGATDAICEVEDLAVQQVRFSNSQIDAVNSWTESHAMMFVAVGKRVISSDLRNLDAADKEARVLVELGKRAPPSKGYGGLASGRFRYKQGRIDRRTASVDDPSKYAQEAIHAAEAAGAVDVGGTLYIRLSKLGIASSAGPIGNDENASVELSVRAFSQPEASGHAVCCTPSIGGLNAREVGEHAAELSLMARNSVQGEEGKFDIIIQPLFFGSISQSVSHMMSALRVEIGSSMFAKKIGKKVASEEITFIDEPTIVSTSRRAFDHEGAPARKNVMIKDGVLKTYLHNTSTAKKFKTRTTGNAGPLIPTPYAYATQPLPFHPVVLPGDWNVEEIISDTKRGLYLNNTWYTRYQNFTTGEFSTIPRDAILRIKDGEIIGAIKNIRISDNMMGLWKNMDAVSKQVQEVYWWDEAAPPSTLPTVRARNVNITRSA